MIKVIKPGRLPAKRIYHGECPSCKAEVEFEEGDARVTDTQKDGRDVSIPCPTAGCTQRIFGTDTGRTGA